MSADIINLHEKKCKKIIREYIIMLFSYYFNMNDVEEKVFLVGGSLEVFLIKIDLSDLKEISCIIYEDLGIKVLHKDLKNLKSVKKATEHLNFIFNKKPAFYF